MIGDDLLLTHDAYLDLREEHGPSPWDDLPDQENDDVDRNTAAYAAADAWAKETLEAIREREARDTNADYIRERVPLRRKLRGSEDALNQEALSE